jgi:hypothetical protein
VSPQPKIQRIKVRGSCRPGDWASASSPLLTETGSIWEWGGNEVVPHHAWTMCYSWRSACSKSTGKSLVKKKTMVHCTLLGKTTGPKGCWPKIPTQTLMENRCSCLDATVVWGLSSTQAWVLWKFTILSLLNPASSVNSILATNYVFTKHFVRSHWQPSPPPPARWSERRRSCTRWMWYG